MTDPVKPYYARRRLAVGFTLTEVMMALFIFSAIMAGVYTLFISCQKLWHRTSLDCYTASESSLAAERFVYGDGWTPGLRAAYRESVSLSSTGSNWVLYYSTPDSTNNYFSYDGVEQTLSFRPGDVAAPFHVARNVASASVVTNSKGISLSVSVQRTEGMFGSTNTLGTFVAFRN